MSADLLRQAASILRERAEDVNSYLPGDPCWFDGDSDLRNAIAGTFPGNKNSARADANWIALMSPTVGLAMADALDHAAQHFWEYNAPHLDAVARLIVGGDA